MDTDYAHSELTEKIIGAVYDVNNVLGRGCLETVYYPKAAGIGVVATSAARCR